MTRRLLLSYLTITAFVLLILEVPLALTYERSQRDRLTTGIERDARSIATNVESTLANREQRDVQPFADRYQQDVGGRVVIVDADGRSVADSDGPVASDFSTRPEFAAVLGRDPLATGRRHSDTLDTDLLYVAVPVVSSNEVVGAVRITFPTTELDARVRRYWLSLAAVGGFVLLTVAGVGFLLARSVTEPLRELERVADRLASGDLDARARQDAGPPEVRALAESVNEMAARLGILVDAQRAFVANASHELRTPLTALRLQLENLRDAPTRDGGSEAEEIEAAATEVARLARLVDGLLGLARAEGARPERVTVDVAAQARERVETWSALAEEQDVSLVLDVNGQAPADVVSGAVTQVLDNLLANAIEVAPPNSEICVQVRCAHEFVELHVIDSGPGLSEAERQHAFDRFWRGNGTASGGSGLGLAIVAQLASASGGDAALAAAPSGGIDARGSISRVVTSGLMRIATWNVNSLKARLPRLEEFLSYADVDVLCLQETKLSDSMFPQLQFAGLGYESVHHGQGQWNGVAILSRVGIDDPLYGFGDGFADPYEGDARLLTATCGGIRCTTTYVPNGRAVGTEFYDRKLVWLGVLRDWLSATMSPDDAAIVLGDFNVAPADRDVWDAKAFVGDTHVTQPERDAVQALCEWGLRDVFRQMYPESDRLYTYWDYRAGDFHQHRGMRIDLALATPPVADRLTWAVIDRNARKGSGPSDHAPLIVDLRDET